MKFIIKEYEEKIKALNEFVSDKAFVNLSKEVLDDKVLSLHEKGGLLESIANKMVNKDCHRLNYNVCPQDTAKVLEKMRADGY